MLAQQHTGAVPENETNDGTSRLGVLRGYLDVQATSLRQMYENAPTGRKAHDQVLASASHPEDLLALEALSRRKNRLQPGKAQQLDCSDGCSGDSTIETLGKRLHLG
jgi:hypothetical protein